MKRWRVLWCAVLAAIASAGGAAADVQNLGDGLGYVRIKDLAAPLPTLDEAAILDLRYVPDATTLAPDLAEQLQQRGPIRIVLHDAAPPAALVRALQQRAPEVLTLGPSGAEPAPDFDLAVDGEADRTAYLAHEAGAALQTLAGTSTPKDRFDEAALIRAQRGEDLAPPPPENESVPSEEAEDRLLRRAIQLARGLLALRPSP